MTACKHTRREFLTYSGMSMGMGMGMGVGVGVGLSAIGGFTNVALAQADLAVRQDVGALTADSSVLTAYRAAITSMRSRPVTDPTSWQFQANIHGAFDNSNAAWNQCQHGSFFFLSWHRMYLYFFERIIREASGDPQFALPYWNYRLPAQRQVPEPFRQPANPATNALFIEQRNPAANAGGFLPESSVLHEQAFQFPNFESNPNSDQSFGGQQVGGFTHFALPHGQLESQPHDIIHVLIGGSGGFMADPRTAALDPIFWLHHSNIDRLWNRWIEQGGGRTNPVDNAVWSNTEFSFFDEDGNTVQLSGTDVIEAAMQLDYRYDDDPIIDPVPVEPCPCPEEGPLTEAVTVAQLLLDSGDNESIELSNEDVTVKVISSEEGNTPVLDNALDQEGAEQNLILKIEGIDYDDQPGVFYEVYLNLPESVRNPSHRDPHYVGNISFFAIKPHHGDNNSGGIQTFNVTKQLNKLRDLSDWKANALDVTFVKRDMMSDLETVAPAPQARVGKISLVKE